MTDLHAPTTVVPPGALYTPTADELAAEPPPPSRAEWLAAADGPALDGFLDALRGLGNPDADVTVQWLREHGLSGRAREFFARLAPDPMLDDVRRTPALPEALARLETDPTFAPLVAHLRTRLRLCPTCGAIRRLPWVDRTAVLAGQRAFMTRMLPSVLVLLCKSLPEGYGAPSMSQVLNLSGELARRPYHRLMGTLQLLVTVCTPGSFEGPHYPALVAAEQMRLLHAAVRSIVAPRVTEPVRSPVEWVHESLGGPEYEVWPGYARFTRPADGLPRVPINLEDMLGTIIGFSLLVVDGLETLGMPLAPADAAAYYEVWRAFGVLMGIYPPGRPDDPGYMPPDLETARAFYAAYRRRNYVGPGRVGEAAAARTANPAGYVLATSHAHMLGHLLRAATHTPFIPEAWWTRVPRFYIRLLAGESAYARLGLPDDAVHGLLRILLRDLPRAWARLMGRTDPGVHSALSRWMLDAMVSEVYGRPIAYPVPDTIEDLRKLVQDARGRTPGGVQVR